MKKAIVTVLLTWVTCFVALSQTNSKKNYINIGIDAGLPINASAFVVAAGVSIKYEYRFIDNFFGTVSVGYTYMPYKGSVKNGSYFFSPPTQSGIGFVPLKAGLKAYFQEDDDAPKNEGFFVEAQLGTTRSSNSFYDPSFTYSGGIGYTSPRGIDIGTRYEAWSKNYVNNQFALRLGYRF